MLYWQTRQSQGRSEHTLERIRNLTIIVGEIIISNHFDYKHLTGTEPASFSPVRIYRRTKINQKSNRATEYCDNNYTGCHKIIHAVPVV